MAPPKDSLLDQLRNHGTKVHCDSLDAQTYKDEGLGPFAQCTSNQALVYSVLSSPKYATFVTEEVAKAKPLVKDGRWNDKIQDVPLWSSLVEPDENKKLKVLVIEYLTVLVALEALQEAPLEIVHVQVNPFYAYNKTMIVENARRTVMLFLLITRDLHVKPRVCIKIPSTWEGLQACRELKTHGYTTLATTLFTAEQAKLAAEVGCTYIAPYVNDLRTQTDKDYTDPSPNIALCTAAELEFTRIHATTEVIPASITDISQCMTLAHSRHLTLSPKLLRELASTSTSHLAAQSAKSQRDDKDTVENALSACPFPQKGFIEDEAGFRMAVTRNAGGLNEAKMLHAINLFCDMQLKLEELVAPYCAE